MNTHLVKYHISSLIVPNAEEKLFYVDRALNVIHQRNDLAEFFVEGGTSTLVAIANQGGYSSEEQETLKEMDEIIDNTLRLLFESPEMDTLKKNRKPLTDEERQLIMNKGAVWHHGPNGEKSPGVWKAEVKGKTWYVCNTHRAMQCKPTLKGAIKAFEFIKTTA